jgi:hypothetical protein
MIDLERLSALKVAAEAACRAAYRRRRTIDGPINWADLHAVSVERVAELYRGEIGERYRVWIEEAADDNYELYVFICDYLTKHGFANVEVRMQW